MGKGNQTNYIQGILRNDLSVLKNIYKESLPEIAKYVKRNSGNSDDAKDVFQEGIMVVFKKAQNGTLELTTTFHVFLFHVCRRIWLKKLKKKSGKEVTLDESAEFTDDETIEEQLLNARKWALFNNKFASLTEECRKVLQMLFHGKTGRQIAEAMGYTEEYAKRKKYKCKLTLSNLIKNDPEYPNLKV